MFMPCKDFGTLVKYVSHALIYEKYNSLMDSGHLTDLISVRFGQSYAQKHAGHHVYSFAIDKDFKCASYDYLYLVEYRKSVQDLIIPDGYYIINGASIKVISINLSIYEEKEVTYEDLASFSTYIREITNDILDTDKIRMTDRAALSIFVAIRLIKNKFGLNKSGYLELTKHLPASKKYVTEDNLVFENLVGIGGTGEISYHVICKAFEEGLNGNPSSAVLRSQVVH